MTPTTTTQTSGSMKPQQAAIAFIHAARMAVHPCTPGALPHGATHLLALPLVLFPVLIDVGHRQQDTSAGADGTHEVCDDGQSPDAHATEGRCGGDVAVELLSEGPHGVAVALQEVLLVPQVAGDLVGVLAGHLNPGDGEQGAHGEHECHVQQGVQRVGGGLSQGVRGADVVHQASHRDQLLRVVVVRLPAPQELHQGVGAVSLEQQLRDEVEVGDQGGLQDDGHIGGVEQLDGVVHLLAAGALGAHGQLDFEALEVHHHAEDGDGGQELHHVGHALAVEGLLQRLGLVGASEEELEGVDDGALKLGACALVEGVGAQRLPHDALADVGGDEQRDGRPQAVAALKHVIDQHHQQAGNEELRDDEDAVEDTELGGRAVHAGPNVHHGLAKGDEQTERRLGCLHELAVTLDILINVDDLGPHQELNNEACGDDGTGTQLHHGTTAGRHDHACPVQRVCPAGSLDAIERQLRAHQENRQARQRGNETLPANQ